MPDRTQSKSGLVHKPVTRSELRSAVIHGVSRTKSDPSSLRITSGQKEHILRRR